MYICMQHQTFTSYIHIHICQTPNFLCPTTMSLPLSLRRALPRSSRQLKSNITVTITRSASSIPTPSTPLPNSQPTSADNKEYQQSPTVPSTWSTSQMPKKEVFKGVRFEQTALDLQPNSPSAMGMVDEDPIRLVSGRRATCDGGE